MPALRQRQKTYLLLRFGWGTLSMRRPQHDGAIDQLGDQPIPALQIEHAAQASRQGKPSVIVEFENERVASEKVRIGDP